MTGLIRVQEFYKWEQVVLSEASHATSVALHEEINRNTEEFIESLSKKLGREIEREEIFVEFEEGKNLFPDKSTWQNPDSYPAFRVDFFNPRKPCIFYNTKIKACGIYEIRPQTCRNYECEYLTQNT